MKKDSSHLRENLLRIGKNHQILEIRVNQKAEVSANNN
jgi:hypothetical protein